VTAGRKGGAGKGGGDGMGWRAGTSLQRIALSAKHLFVKEKKNTRPQGKGVERGSEMERLVDVEKFANNSTRV